MRLPRALSLTLFLLVIIKGCHGAASNPGVDPVLSGQATLHFTCGTASVSLERQASASLMRVGEQTYPMNEVPSASGARLEAVDDASTWLHEKSGEALVAIAGRQLAACRVAQPPGTPFAARGQEPGWHLVVADDRIELTADYGERRIDLPLEATEQDGAATRFRAAHGEQLTVTVTATAGICRDSMSGMPHPYAVTARLGDERLDGCGGEPLDLLAGHGWAVEYLDGSGLEDRSRITLSFLPEDGRVVGTGSCNRYSAGFTLTGEGLALGPVAATKMACAPPVMQQESRFFAILERVYRFDVDATGALTLISPEATMIAYPDLAADE